MQKFFSHMQKSFARMQKFFAHIQNGFEHMQKGFAYIRQDYHPGKKTVHPFKTALNECHREIGLGEWAWPLENLWIIRGSREKGIGILWGDGSSEKSVDITIFGDFLFCKRKLIQQPQGGISCYSIRQDNVVGCAYLVVRLNI